MMRRRYFLLMLVVFAGTALWSVAQSSPDEVEQHKLQALRKNPEQLAKLRENLQAFLNSKKKDAVLKLDAALHELPTSKQARYWQVLERYADWLEKLKDADIEAYQAINEAPDAAARLTLIKEKRDREWMEQQPKAYRERWVKLQGDARSKFVADLRQDERQKRQHWLIAPRFWKELETKKVLPCRLSDFGAQIKNKDGTFKMVNKVEDYVENYLMKYLTPDEKQQLKNAEGRWPDFPLALVEVARKRPSALPPYKKDEVPIRPQMLPVYLANRLPEKKGFGAKGKKNELKPYEGRSEYVSKLVEVCTNKGNTPFEFEIWASNFNSLQAPMKTFLTNQLIPKLDLKDKANLEYFEGKWPYYPQTIQELAKKHGLDPPWHILPEPDKWHWSRYRLDRRRTPETEEPKAGAL